MGILHAASRSNPSAPAMSVPPPSCTFISTSVGSSTWSLRSTTAVSKATRLTRNDGKPLKMPGHHRAVDHRVHHRAAAIDGHDDVPGHVPFDARRKVQRLEDQPLLVAIIVFEIGPDGPLPIEIADDLERAAALPIEPAPEDRANFAGQLPPQFLDHLADDAAGRSPAPGHQVRESQHRLEQFVVRLQLLQDFRIGDQFGHAVAIERMPFDDLDGLARKQLADLLEPLGNRQHAVAETGAAVCASPRTPRPWYSRP